MLEELRLGYKMQVTHDQVVELRGAMHEVRSMSEGIRQSISLVGRSDLSIRLACLNLTCTVFGLYRLYQTVPVQKGRSC